MLFKRLQQRPARCGGSILPCFPFETSHVALVLGLVIAIHVHGSAASPDQDLSFDVSHALLKTEFNEPPSSSPTPNDFRNKVAGTIWKIKNVKISLHADGSAGYFLKGGTWTVATANQVKVYDKDGNLRLTLTINPDLQRGSAVWRDGNMHTTNRINPDSDN